jgi:hypothetical protein
MNDTGHGVPSFSDLFLGIELAGTFTGHDVTLADAAAASLFIGAALGGGMSFEPSSLPSGNVQDVPALQSSGHADGGYSTFNDPGRLLDLPGIARGRTSVHVLYWPHGMCEPRAEIARSAARWGLERYDPRYQHALKPFSHNEPRLLAGFVPGGSDETGTLPSGWYRGAAGTTHLWRDCFRLRRKTAIFSQKPATYDQDHRTFLVAMGATWHYHHTPKFWYYGDYETRVKFGIYSQPFGGPGGYQYDEDSIRALRHAAERIANDIHDYLAANPPPAGAVEFRRKMDPRLTRPGDSS